MVKFTIYMKAETENVETIYNEPDEYVWNIMVKCGNCKETYENVQTLCKGVTKPTRIGKGFVHYSSKCKFCKMENSIVIVEDSMKPYCGTRNDFQAIGTFECRGVEVVAYKPGGGWSIRTQGSSTILSDINLEEDYVDYCDEGVVSVMDMEFEVRRTS